MNNAWDFAITIVVGAVLCFIVSPLSGMYKNDMSIGDFTAIGSVVVAVFAGLKLKNRLGP